ncbi:hypothetical protein HGB07_08155 [Candidatus Roizmanbacteria bacterium]|nr:hypothetical protein [Candidatus Roizmanbacteria bacterium]
MGIDKFITVCARVFDRVFDQKLLKKLEKVTVYTALITFVADIVLIFIAQQIGDVTGFWGLFHRGYLSAIYIPFSIILFFSIFLLVMAIPQSLTFSIARQYEVISLIAIRSVFKDISSLESLDTVSQHTNELLLVLTDMAGALILFSLVALFYFIIRNRPTGILSDGHDTFIRVKKTITLFLALTVAITIIFAIRQWGVEIVQFTQHGVPISSIDHFFTIFFNILVFTDVFILILSLLYTDSYALVFRDAGFVVSTIIIRFSLSAGPYYHVFLPIVALLFGCGVMWVYMKFCQISPKAPIEH